MPAPRLDDLPSYADLLERTDAPPGSSWGLFGADDDRGTLNFLRPKHAVEAAGLVRRGAVFNMDHPVDAFAPPLVAHRQTVRHTMFQLHENHRDDHLDAFYPQASSQIDGLRHMRHRRHGFYNRAPDTDIRPGNPRLGINRWAETGIVGRGVLLDVERFLSEHGQGVDHATGTAIDAATLEATASAFDVEVRPGDVLILRTGWAGWYLGELDDAGRAEVRVRRRFTGLAQSHDLLAWLWDRRVPLIATDTVGVEVLPPVDTSPFAEPDDATIHAGLMHPQMIALLGLALGELWAIDALADDCSADGVWECMVVAKPLFVVGGVGSPPNAVAIK